MNHFAARAGVDGSRLLSGPRFAYEGYGLGADVALVEPSLEAWSAEDARMLNILGSLGTNSTEGKALIVDIEAQFGAGNWYPEWTRLQDYYTEKYMAAKSDAERLAELQATTTQQAAASDPAQMYLPAGSVPYSIHDINAFASMTAEQQADFINGFADGSAAAYFMMVAGNIKPEALTMIPPEYGGNKGVYVFGGVDYLTFEAWDAAVKASGQQLPGQVTSVTTSTGEVITDPDRLKNLTHEEVFGTPSQTAPTWTPPPAPPETGGFYPATVEPFVPSPEFVTAPSKSIAPAAIAPSAGFDDFSTTAPTAPGTTVNVKGQPKVLKFGTDSFAPTATPNIVTEDELPVATAGFGGSLGLLAIAGIGLAILTSKRKR